MKVTNETPLAMLTVGQLDEFLAERTKCLNHPTPTTKRYVYGLVSVSAMTH